MGIKVASKCRAIVLLGLSWAWGKHQYWWWPKTDTMGSRFGKCTCGYPNKEGIPCGHMVAVSKLGTINGLTRIAVTPHWYTTAQGHNQFPEKTYVNTHKTLKINKGKLYSTG
jgi:hypothetical protein